MRKGIIFTQPTTVIRKLNIDKIHTIDDVKRVLEFLDIEVKLQEGLTVKGYDKVKDLFEME